MKLYMPTKVYNEKNCVENHSRELAALGTKALIVTGKHSSRINGSLEDVKGALERERITRSMMRGFCTPKCRPPRTARSGRRFR